MIAEKKKKMSGKGIKVFLDEPFSVPSAASVKEQPVTENTLNEASSCGEKMEKAKETIAQVKSENVLVKRKLKRAQNKIVNLKESKEALKNKRILVSRK